MDAPVVSVIIPAYNCAATVGRAIQSILDQSYTDLEVVVVDDESRDKTSQVITQFSDPRLVYLLQNHAERSVARNTGIAHSRGGYLAFVDADDWWGKTKLDKQIALFEANHSLGLVYCDTYYVNARNGKILGQYGRRATLRRGRVWKDLCEVNFIQSPTPVIPRWVFDRIGFFDPDMPPLEDWDMWLRIAASYPVDYVPEPLAFYQYDKNSTSLARPSDRLYRSHLKLLDKIETQLDGNAQEDLEKLKKHRAIVHYIYGVQMLHRGKYQLALRSLHEARRLNPAFSLTYARLVQASVLVSQSRWHGQ